MKNWRNRKLHYETGNVKTPAVWQLEKIHTENTKYLNRCNILLKSEKNPRGTGTPLPPGISIPGGGAAGYAVLARYRTRVSPFMTAASRGV
jgi:hypothetical protein